MFKLEKFIYKIQSWIDLHNICLREISYKTKWDKLYFTCTIGTRKYFINALEAVPLSFHKMSTYGYRRRDGIG